jgi:hypothetical protein
MLEDRYLVAANRILTKIIESGWTPPPHWPEEKEGALIRMIETILREHILDG